MVDDILSKKRGVVLTKGWEAPFILTKQRFPSSPTSNSIIIVPVILIILSIYLITFIILSIFEDILITFDHIISFLGCFDYLFWQSSVSRAAKFNHHRPSNFDFFVNLLDHFYHIVDFLGHFDYFYHIVNFVDYFWSYCWFSRQFSICETEQLFVAFPGFIRTGFPPGKEFPSAESFNWEHKEGTFREELELLARW